MSLYRPLLVCITLVVAVTVTLAAPATQPTKPYPLNTCMVTDEELGGMGEPIVIAHEGREIKFCCGGCVKAFKKDPAKYLKKLDGPVPTTKPVG